MIYIYIYINQKCVSIYILFVLLSIMCIYILYSTYMVLQSIKFRCFHTYANMKATISEMPGGHGS